MKKMHGPCAMRRRCCGAAFYAVRPHKNQAPVLFLLVRNGFLRTFPSSRVGLGILTTYRQTLPVTDASVAADLLEPLDVHRHFATQITLYQLMIVLDGGGDSSDLIVSQILDAGIRVHVCLCQETVRTCTADAVDVSETDLDALFSR